jgi:hypothetical protein
VGIETAHQLGKKSDSTVANLPSQFMKNKNKAASRTLTGDNVGRINGKVPKQYHYQTQIKMASTTFPIGKH